MSDLNAEQNKNRNLAGSKSSNKTGINAGKNSRDSEFCWGFCVVICLTLGLASFLMFSAWGRFSGIAWGSVENGGNIEVVNEGFITVEVTDTKREALLAQARLNANDKPDLKSLENKLDLKDLKKDLKAEDKSAQATQKVSQKAEPEVKEAKNAVASKTETPKNAATETKNNNNQNSAFPLFASVMPDASDVNALLEVEDFGPLPKFLSDYESIVLNIHEDGTKMPEPEEPEELEEAANAETQTQDDVTAKGEAVKTAKSGGEIQEHIKLEETGTSWKEHVVKAGETLSDIALAHGGVTAQDILRANGLKDANRLSANQILLIPDSPAKVEDTYDEVKTRQMRVVAAREKPKPLKIISYVVAAGDSLWSISNSQNIELDTLIGSNAFKSSAKLRPGAVLRIPNQDGIFYTLAKGDKIENICKLYGVDVNKLKLVNPTVDIVSLKAGDEIFLPGAKINAVKVASAKESKENNNKKVVVNVNNNKSEASSSSSRTYRWPVMGRINSPFGWRQHPITKRSNFHTGIDIKADRGTVIRGAGSGKVVYSGWMGGYGKVIVLEHNNGQSTLYAHCSTLLVRQGETVSQGENIARVGTTGQSTGPHLHFEVRVANSPVNPLKYLK